MNKNLLLWLSVAVAVGCSRLPASLDISQWRPQNLTCHPALLASYDLVPLALPTSQKNFVCGGIANNCCSLPSQFKIFKRWTSRSGGQKLARYYKDFLRSYQDIFDLFGRVEEFAKGVSDGIPGGVTTNCGQLSRAVLGLRASGAKQTVVAAFQKAFRFLFDARRGFYCSLCDSDALAHILPQQGVLRVSRGFCGSLVKETMNAMSIKHEYFQKVTRLYGQLLVSCNGAGEYNARAKLKRIHMFFSRKRILRDIGACKAGLKTSSALSMCTRYCERFNPARLSRMFEGQFRRTGLFREWLKTRLNRLNARASSANNKDDLNFKGRILQGQASGSPSTPATNPATGTSSTGTTAPATTTGGSATDKKAATPAPKLTVAKAVQPVSQPNIVVGINQFNGNYATQLVVPIAFSARDIPKRRRRRFALRQSLFRLRSPQLFNVADFKLVVSKVGLNPIKYGYNALVNRQGYKALQAALVQTNSGSDQKSAAAAPKASTGAAAQKTATATPTASKSVRRRK